MNIYCYLLFLHFRERIALAIGIVKESASALIDMPTLSFMPFVQTFLFAAFTALWIVFSIYLASSGALVEVIDAVTGIQMKVFEFDKNAQICCVALVFVWFWTIGFFEAVGSMVCSHAVIAW